MRRTRKTTPLAGLFGFRVEKISPRSVIVRLPFRRDFVRAGGTVNGPAMMAVADYAMYVVVIRAIGARGEGAVTSSLNINFLRRPPPVDIVAHGRMIRCGKRLAFGEVTLYAEGEREPVAHITVTYSVPPGIEKVSHKAP
ncbi:MAG: PaaI family thioesterase [Rhodospirillales bacterium]|nr:PaaI family thioesterase [Rhodospirillales bacterium]